MNTDSEPLNTQQYIRNIVLDMILSSRVDAVELLMQAIVREELQRKVFESLERHDQSKVFLSAPQTSLMPPAPLASCTSFSKLVLEQPTPKELVMNKDAENATHQDEVASAILGEEAALLISPYLLSRKVNAIQAARVPLTQRLEMILTPEELANHNRLLVNFDPMTFLNGGRQDETQSCGITIGVRLPPITETD